MQKMPEQSGLCSDWSECGDSNPGPPAPKAGALPTAQHPVIQFSGAFKSDGLYSIIYFKNDCKYSAGYVKIFLKQTREVTDL